MTAPREMAKASTKVVKAIPAETKPAPAVPAKGFSLRAYVNRLRQFSLVAVLLVLWEASVRTGIANRQLFPAPTDVARALVELAELGLLWQDIWASVTRVTIGFLIAAVLAILLGTLLGRSERLAFYVMPVIDLARPISVIAWVPLAILWFGLGDKPAWFIIFLGAFFPIFTNTYAGVRSIERIHIQVAECFGAGRWLFFREVLIPSALPYILAGMRIGLGVGWMCVIAAEMIAATSGLGYMIQLARTLIETEKVIAGMVVIALVGLAMNGLMFAVERRLTPWRQSRT